MNKYIFLNILDRCNVIVYIEHNVYQVVNVKCKQKCILKYKIIAKLILKILIYFEYIQNFLEIKTLQIPLSIYINKSEK